MSSGKELLARYKDAKTRKDQAESTLRDAYLYALPQRENFNRTYTELQKKNNHIFDSTAVVETQKFATRVQSTITPPWRTYTQLQAGPDVPKEIRESQNVEIQLKEMTDIYFSYLNHSNVHTQEHESFQDLAIGTGAMDMWQGAPGQPPFRFDAVPLSELVLEEGPMGIIESSWRQKNPAISHVERLYPGAELSAEQQKLKVDKPFEKVELIEGVLFDPATERTFGVLLDPGKEARIMWQTFWPVSPRQVFRWSVAPGEVYGRGPVLSVLPDIKTANKVVEFILREAALQVSGIYTSTDDTATNPYTIRIAPGVVIPVTSNDQRNPTIRALERSGDIGLGFDVLDQLQKNIRRVLLAGPDIRPEGPVRSATEIAIEDRRDIQEVGASYGRLQTELVERRTARGVQILGDQGRIAPLRVDGRNVTLKHQSPLARAQDQEELVTIEQGMQLMAGLPPEVTALGIKMEELPSHIADKLGWDPRLKRSPEEREAMKQQAQDLAAQSAGAEAA